MLGLFPTKAISFHAESEICANPQSGGSGLVDVVDGGARVGSSFGGGGSG